MLSALRRSCGRNPRFLTRNFAEVVPASQTSRSSAPQSTGSSDSGVVTLGNRVPVREDHGLYAFFRKKEPVPGQTSVGEAKYETLGGTPNLETLHSGRSWKASELRLKSFEDLHILWYILLRERNLLASQQEEVRRLGVMRPLQMFNRRTRMCRKSMARIKYIMNERRLAYEGAVQLAEGQKKAHIANIVLQQQLADHKTERQSLVGRQKSARLRLAAQRAAEARVEKQREAGNETVTEVSEVVRAPVVEAVESKAAEAEHTPVAEAEAPPVEKAIKEQAAAPRDKPESATEVTSAGNARIVGLATDLKLSPPAYNTSLALYFVAYVLFEVPANTLRLMQKHYSLKQFDPQFWLPTLTLVWGIVSVCQGLVTNQAGLLGIRFLLGATEAGLFPGVVYVFSVYYVRNDRRARVAIFFGGAALAGAFGGILAFAIGKMEGIGGRRGWQWIFILEGLLTILVSLLAYFIVPSWSYKAKFLTESERKRLLFRLENESDPAHREPFQWKYVKSAFTDRFVWAYAMLFHGYAFVLYSLSLFLPTIIAGLGFQSWQAQLMTVPPNTLAALSIAVTVWLSVRYDRRAIFIIAAAFVAIIGYIILLTARTPGAQYVGVHFAAAGIYTGNALLLSWPGENVAGQTKRAVAVAAQITFGDIGAIAGVLIYRPNFAGHQYRKPHIIAIGYLFFSIVVASYLWFGLSRENKRKEELLLKSPKAQQEASEDSVEERRRLGDRHVLYRYVY
ncbi:hypothetical protein D9757_005518 [Collybiopsis confluens]|uniref:54S ribosomal protein L4, mitochondrial n=1 Tax=Collybiopsis confluens TaxID=2823264 RepID=A0A8H5HLE6_9AGAR|nr:hypothetical protein D9757_005518 [Collybiopsis confluens]